VLIRPAKTIDATAIMQIYNREVLETTHTFDLHPRTLEEQRRYIDDRSGGLVVLVAEADDGTVVGFGSISFYRDRPGYRTSVENSVYVHPDHHRAGVGSGLLGALIDSARNHGFHAMFARIVDSQEASVRLHRRHGFEMVGIEREAGRKFNKFRDVTLMQLLL
jgi:phosphinothricin acetyltransferase